MSIHFLMLISETPEMLFRTEFLIRSIKRFSKDFPVFFSIVVNGYSDTHLIKPCLSKGRVDNSYIVKNAEILRSPFKWHLPIPHRWFVEPKSEVCVFIDADMIACQKLDSLFDLDKGVFHGVEAYKNHLTLQEWRSLGIEKDLRYFNFGMLVVPSHQLRAIGECLLEITKEVVEAYKSHYYFAAQIALAKAIHILNIQTNCLPKTFNWFDLWPESDLSQILFLHYMNNKHYIKSHNIPVGKNSYVDLAHKISNQVFMEDRLFL